MVILMWSYMERAPDNNKQLNDGEKILNIHLQKLKIMSTHKQSKTH